MSLITNNRKAGFDYFIEDQFTAGIMLEGWEIKSIRAKGFQLTGAHVLVNGTEVILVGSHIASMSNTTENDPMRSRRLLLTKAEIIKIHGKIIERGYTVVPLNAQFVNGKVKVEIGLAKGKKLHDKRNTIKDRELSRALMQQ